MATQDMRALGRIGGLTTAAKHGPGHMASIGAIGFATFSERYCNGNRAATRRLLGLDGRRRDYDSTPGEALAWLEERKAKGDR